MSMFAQRLKLLRNEADLSQQELANQLKCVSKSSINMYERGEREPGLETTEAIADFFNVDIDYLYGRTDIKNKYADLMAGIIKENQSGRPAAIDELRRLFGTEHSIHNIYACEDSKRIALLYYKALERNVALSLTDIIGTVDQFDGSQAEKTMLLLHAYLKAGQPIRNIVDTALDPYVEDLDEPPCSNSQIAPIKSDTKPAPVKQTVLPFPKAKINHRKEDNFDELTVFEEAAAAGLGNYLSDTPVTHMEQYPSGIIPSGTNYGVPISGDSMMPKFKNGSTAFVQSTPVLNDGEIGIFALNGNSYIKQLIVDRENGTVRLHSLNPAYKDIIVSEGDTLYTLGRVLGSYPG